MSMSLAQTPLARLLRAVEARPAAADLTPAMLLALQAFDAAYRLGSFRVAAQALHLTPSAISHRIRALEKQVGESLFVRKHRTISPTRAGRALAEATGRAFSELARVAASGKSHGVQSRLRLAVATTFATSWLIPRIKDFMAAHARVELVIECVTREIDFENEPYDAAINSGTGAWPGLSATELLRIFTTPVCTPETCARFRLKSPSDLLRAPLIAVTAYPLAWPLWLERAGILGAAPQPALAVDSFIAATTAALSDAGIALGLDPLFRNEEKAGVLVRPFAIRQPTGSYWLIHRPVDARNPALVAFRRWLLRSLGSGARK